MNITRSKLPGVLLIDLRIFPDERGYFLESWNQNRYAAAGIPEHFVQDNISFSRRAVLRGLHYQYPHAQGKLVSVLQGEVYDVAVDIRAGSPTFGEWESFTLSAENGRQLYIPEGFAHGFLVTSETALFSYKCTDFYHPEAEGTLLWDDPDIGIEWPLPGPDLSPKDRAGLRLRDIPPDKLPKY